MTRGGRHIDLMDPWLWARAGWSTVAYIVPVTRPPVLALVFENRAAGCAIFHAWWRAFGEIDVGDVVRVAIIDGVPSGMPAGYLVHVSLEQESGTRTETRGPVAPAMPMRDRWCHVPAPGRFAMQRFLEQAQEHERYLMVPAASENGLVPHPLVGIGKQRIWFRCLEDVGRGADPDAGLWALASNAWRRNGGQFQDPGDRE